jgi:hypothetical protein
VVTRISKEALQAYCKRTGIDMDKLLKQQTPVKALAITHAQPDDDKRNATEKRFDTDMLWPQKLAGLILEYRFESVNLRIGKDKAFYKPDYLVIRADGHLVFREVKGGYIEPDALVKFRVASLLYPWFLWELWQWDNDLWRMIEVH